VKITKSQLKRIIKEELQAVLKESTLPLEPKLIKQIAGYWCGQKIEVKDLEGAWHAFVRGEDFASGVGAAIKFLPWPEYNGKPLTDKQRQQVLNIITGARINNPFIAQCSGFVQANPLLAAAIKAAGIEICPKVISADWLHGLVKFPGAEILTGGFQKIAIANIHEYLQQICGGQ